MLKIKHFLHRSSVHFALITILGLLAYSNTFDVPFHFDDRLIIVENPIIRDLSHFFRPSEADSIRPFDTYPSFKSRYAALLSFALNYKAHGLGVRGYHITNLAVHILNGILIYLMVVLTFKTPSLNNSPLKNSSRPIALLASLLFVSHPVQTQTVTYIVQRFASMATMFYLLSLVMYIKWRLRITEHQSSRFLSLLLYLFSLLSAILAIKTKEIAFTLPVAVALHEFMFFSGKAKRRLLNLIPLLLTMLIIPLTLINIDKPIGEMIGDVGESTKISNISRFDYLLTESRVMVTYIRLLLFPINQNLYYDYPVYHSLVEIPVLLSCIFISSIFILGVYMLRRSRTREETGRLVAFGILWFFITLSVESSFIPLHPIYEHRLYLPSVGFFPALAASAFLFYKKLKNPKMQKAASCALILVLLVLSCATYARNTVWRSETSLWEDTAGKSPEHALVQNNLGLAYWSKGMLDKAIDRFLISVRLKPDYATAHNNLGNAYEAKGLTGKAIGHYLEALSLKPELAEPHFNLGVICLKKGLRNDARQEFEKALEIDPTFSKAKQFLDYISNMDKTSNQ
jgi:tetratricopeptide (TPR) repeat protein